MLQAVTLVAIVAVFVYPSLPAQKCSADVQPANAVGHWFCSVTVSLSHPASCGPDESQVNGTTVVTSVDGYDFSAHLFERCVEVYNLGLNASVVQGSAGAFVVITPNLPLGQWENWTSPQNLSGFQWIPPINQLNLLYAP